MYYFSLSSLSFKNANKDFCTDFKNNLLYAPATQVMK